MILGLTFVHTGWLVVHFGGSKHPQTIMPIYGGFFSPLFSARYNLPPAQRRARSRKVTSTWSSWQNPPWWGRQLSLSKKLCWDCHAAVIYLITWLEVARCHHASLYLLLKRLFVITGCNYTWRLDTFKWICRGADSLNVWWDLFIDVWLALRLEPSRGLEAPLTADCVCFNHCW